MMLRPIPTLDGGVRRRLARLGLALLGLAYARRTWQSLHAHHGLLRRQAEAGGRLALVLGALKYTFTAQIMACLEYLLALVKPVLALRIARLLVYKGDTVLPNVLYGRHPRNTIDLYGIQRPEHDLEAAAAAAAATVDADGATGTHRPVLLFVHGGAWSFGHKWQYGLVGKYLAKHGFLVAVINYRTYPMGSVVDQVEDVQDAIHWVAENVAAYGGDRDHIFLMGHSSGAHVSALTLTQSALRSVGSRSAQSASRDRTHTLVRGFIGLAGPYDIAEHYEFESNRRVGPIDGVHEISTMKPAILGPSNFARFSPTKLLQDAAENEADLAMPSFHIIHGNADEVVPASSSLKFAQSLLKARQTVDYIEIDGCTHEDIVFAIMGDNVSTKAELIAHLKRITGAALPAYQQSPPPPSDSHSAAVMTPSRL